MTLRPLPGFILVEEIDDTHVHSSGLALPETAKDKPIKGIVLASSDTFLFQGDIVALVEGATLSDNYQDLVGKKVVYKKWATTDLEEEGKKLSFVAYADLLGVYE